jgi:hypothetical protein
VGKRETLLAAVQARVDQVAARGDWSGVLESAALAEAHSLAECVADGTADREAWSALGWLYYRRSQALPPEDAEPNRAVAVRYFTGCFIAGVDDLPQPLLASLAERAAPTATDLLARVLRGTASPELLTFAMALCRRITRNLPDSHPDYARHLDNLAVALGSRYDSTGDPSDLDEAVETGRAAVQATAQDHPGLTGRLSNLAAALGSRYDRTGDPSDLDEAVETGRAGVRILPDGHPDKITSLTNLCTNLRTRFDRAGDLADLDGSVEAGRAAVAAAPSDHPNRAVILACLSSALETRFSRTGDPADLDEAVDVCRAAVRILPDSSFQKATCLTILGVSLATRFERRGNVADLDEAVETDRAAVLAYPAGHPARAHAMTNLGLALRSRFLRRGELTDLDEAVEAGRGAVLATPNGQPDRAARLSNLSIALESRFDRIGDVADLDEAAEACRAAIRILPDGHPHRAAVLANLSNALVSRFDRIGDVADLDEAVEACRAAIRVLPDGHPGKAISLTNLCGALWARFRRTGNPADLDEAVEAGRGVVRVLPSDEPNLARPMINLSLALQDRFKHAGNLADLDEAVEACRAAVQATPDDHPDRTTRLSNLSASLLSRFGGTGDLGDMDEALSVLEQAVDMATAPPSLRIRAARVAAEMAAPSDPGRASRLMEQAVLLLPDVAPRRLRRGDQQHALGTDASGLAADAAALALADTSMDAPERALRALRLAEAGRAVLLSQALDTRSDLTDLRDQHPELAKRFSELRELLDQEPSETATATGDDHPERTGRERHRLAGELEDLLGRIRACEGFAAFGLPPTIDDLLSQAAHGPVVTFNISSFRSDALLLTRDGITTCPLPKLTHAAVTEQVNAFYGALTAATASDGDRIGAQQTLRQILEWLWEAAAEPALTALTALGELIPPAQDGELLPQVWWAPGGLLGLLPLHAAGFHTAPGHGPNRRTVMDRVISSYTPTIRTLHHARQRPRPTEAARSLIVSMPTTPGLSPLRNVPEEARRIRSLLPRPIELTEPASGDASLAPGADTPTAAAVLARLPQCTIAHFACHGASNRTDPSQSMLFLHDHATTPLTVSALAQVALDHAQLAYLSACSTADPGGSDLLDEAIHLTSAFQLVGFPHVIGTLWPINDRLAVEIAESFYAHLAADPSGTLDADRSAAALHETIRAVRDRYPATPSLWAAYLHSGA